MSHDLEEDLRRRLHARAAGYDLAPGAVATAADRGRRRLRRRRATFAGGMAVVAVAAGLVAVNGWDRIADDDRVVVADGGPAPDGTSEAPQPAPRLIARDADDAFPGLFAHLTGTLVVTSEGCIAAAGADGERRGIVWGHGWSAGTKDGKAVVLDPSGAVFASEGDRLGLGGGGSLDSRYSRHPCATESMWIVNDSQGRPQDSR